VEELMVRVHPRREGESLTTFVSRARAELKEKGAEFNSRAEPLILPEYRFEHFEYKRSVNGVERSMLTWIGPFGVYVLSFQFSGDPEKHELMRPFAEKIMRSFQPGENPKLAMEAEYPDGDWGQAAGETPEAQEGAAGGA
jgi:hypothetical protein